MSLRALRTLVAIARHGSFVRAGEAVHLTQSAVSLQVRSLEKDFNAVLFDRSRRSPVLTDAGRIAVERAREIISLYDGIASDIGGITELRGRLRIGAIRSALAGFLPKALAVLSAAHPKLHITVASGMSEELSTRVEAGELDVAITTEPVKLNPIGLAITELYDDGFWIIAPVSYTGRDLEPLLRTQPFIRFERRAWAGRTIDQELSKMQLKVQASMELDSQEAIIQMVEWGLGVSVIPMDRHHIERFSQVAFQAFGLPQKMRRLVMMERRDRPVAKLAEALARALQDQASASNR